MEENNRKIKLIHIILFGVILMFVIVAVVIFLNSSKDGIKKSIQEVTTISEKDISYAGDVKRKSIEEENEDYFKTEVEIIENPIITNVGKSKNELLFKDAKIENDKLLINLELYTTSSKIKDLDKIFKFAQARLEIGTNIYNLNQNSNDIFEITKIDENLYEIYLVYDVRGLKYDRNINFISQIEIEEYNTINKFYDNSITEIGRWNLEFSISEKIKKDFNEKYKTEDLIIQSGKNSYWDEYCEILGIRVLENYLILVCKLSNYTTEPGIYYSLEFFDNNDNSYAINQDIQLIGGLNQDILLKKFDLNSNINVRLNVFTEDKILAETNCVICLADYIKEIDENPTKQIEKAFGKDIEFSFDSNKFEAVSNNVFDTVDLNNLKYPIRLDRIGDVGGFSIWQHGFYIDRYKNKFNETLKELYEVRSKLLELGINSERSEKYSIYENIEPLDCIGIPTDSKEYIFTHEEMMKIYDGEVIEKDGKEFNKEKIKEITLPTCENKNFANVRIDGIDAITYIYYNGEGTRKYILIIDEDIYEITIPLNLPIIEDYNEVLNSICFDK